MSLETKEKIGLGSGIFLSLGFVILMLAINLSNNDNKYAGKIATLGVGFCLSSLVGFLLLTDEAQGKNQKQPQEYTNELITEATKHLSPTENIEKCVTFVELQIISLAEDKCYGIAIATDKRILIYKFTLGGHKIKSLNYSKVSAVEYEQGLLFDSLEFSTSGEKLSIDKINKGSTADFVGFVNSKI